MVMCATCDGHFCLYIPNKKEIEIYLFMFLHSNTEYAFVHHIILHINSVIYHSDKSDLKETVDAIFIFIQVKS